MEAAFVLILISIIDLPSIISIVGGIVSKKLWQIGLIVFSASIIGELLNILTHISHQGFWIFCYRLLGQAIVGFSVYALMHNLRKKEGVRGGPLNPNILRLMVLFLSLVCSLGIATLIIKGISRPVTKDFELDKLDANIERNIEERREQQRIDFLN